MYFFITTEVICFLTMALALWLGLYVVTRNPRSLIAWLTALALWAITRLFMDVWLALNPPPMPSSYTLPLRFFFPFWRAITLSEQGGSGWLQGWSVTTTIMLWHHATVLMRPGPLTPWRWTRILSGYAVAAAWIILNITTPFFFASTTGSPLLLNTLKAGPLYPIFAVFLLLYAGMSIVNLTRSTYTAPATMWRNQLITLALATVMMAFSVPLSIAASIFNLPIPIAALAVLLGISVTLMGYGVARYSSLVSGHAIRRDFIHNATTIGSVTILYWMITWLLVRAYNAPKVAILLVVMMAIITHSLIDVGRRMLDALIYRRETRRLRDNLRRLTTLAGEQTDRNEKLSQALDSLCASVQATYGLIVLFEGEALQLAAAHHWHHDTLALSSADLSADDALLLEPGHFPPSLVEAALLIPLYTEAEQVGALILGRPLHGTSYSQADLELLLYPSDWLADAIQNTQREATYLAQIAALAEQSQSQADQHPPEISIKAVENALRRLVDYAYLGQHPLAKMKLVKSRLPEGTVTHLDRGKAVYSILAEALEKLRPHGQQPNDPPPREWYPYLILRLAYLEDIPNREIMARLYISEGTFNRTRRAALRAVTRLLAEMEAAVNRN